jgi:hypothetical protein
MALPRRRAFFFPSQYFLVIDSLRATLHVTNFLPSRRPETEPLALSATLWALN